MYVAMNRMIKRKPRGQSNAQVLAQEAEAEEVANGEEELKVESGDHTVVGEQGDELLYISKRHLKE